MRKIPEQNAYEGFWSAFIYTIAALRAWPSAQSLAEPMVTHLAQGDVLDAEVRRRAQTAAELSARAEVLDLFLDHEIRETHSDTLHVFRQDRGAEGFRYLFPENIGATTRFALAAQTEVATTLHERLAAPQYEGPVQAHREPLASLLTQARALLAERREHDRAEELLRQQVQAWKAEANRLRELTFAELIKQNREGRAFAERFFS